MQKDYNEIVKVFKAFSDEKRLIILELLQSGEKCACKLLEELNIGQSTLSHHMRILCESNVVTGRKEGKWTYYSINSEGVKKVQELLELSTKLNVSNECKECNCDNKAII